MLLLLLSLMTVVPGCWTYCALLGANPGFRSAPHVEQISLTSVRVSWEGLVTKIECADQFIVKSWNARNPNDYRMSDLLPVDQFSYVVTDLVPNQVHVFQAVAREDKGIFGKDWNKSPQAVFRTTRTNPTVPPSSESYINPTIFGPIRSSGAPSTNTPQGILILAALIIGILLGVLIIVGILWNIVERSRKKKSTDTDSEHSDSETDSMDLDLENVDLESRVGSIRPNSRACSTIRSSTLRASHRRKSMIRHQRRFSLTLSEPYVSDPIYNHSIFPCDCSSSSQERTINLENKESPQVPGKCLTE